MKQFFTSLLLIVGSLQCFSQINWSTPVTVYSGSGSNLHPRISLNRSGDPLILWGKTDDKAFFSRWNGSSFTSPAVISGSFTVFAQSWAGPDLASFGDTVYATMKVRPEMTTTNYSYLTHSYDGGINFSSPVRVDNIGSDISRFPIVTATSDGNPLVSFMKFDAGTMANARYVVCSSSDFGTTFSTDVQASYSPGGAVCDCCPAALLSSGTNAVMLFRNNLNDIRDMWAGISTNGGSTFPNMLAVDTTNWMITSCPSSGPDGFMIGDSLYTVFMSKASGTAFVNLSHASINGGNASHSRITGMFTGLSSQNYPRIANAGNVSTVVWKQNTSSGNSIVYSFTNNISNGFSGYTTVTGATGSGVMNADVTMSPGEIHIVWEDDNSGNVMYVKGTYSVNTSIQSLENKELIDLYPNPANESFTVSLNKISKINSCYLSDIVGRSIELTPIIKDGKAIFSLVGISKGAYYFILKDDTGKNYYSKIIIQ